MRFSIAGAFEAMGAKVLFREQPLLARVRDLLLHRARCPSYSGSEERRVGRVTAIGALLLVVAGGLVTRRFPIGIRLWDHHAGEALYAAMVTLFVILARPTLRARTVAAIAMALCTALELFQATGIPARAPRLIRFALGATFAWSDLLCYVVGVGVLAACQAWAQRAARQAGGR